MPWDERHPRAVVEAAVRDALCWSDVLRALGLGVRGHNHRTLQRWCRRWELDTSHFDANAARGRATRGRARPLDEVLVAGSAYHRGHLKRRLYESGLKAPICELCGTGEQWRGRRMALILDHVNGVHDDNRLENLRIVCPNCNATLDTHCGRNLRLDKVCVACGSSYRARAERSAYCSKTCFDDARRGPRPADPSARKVQRPPLDQLLAEVEELGWSAVGRRYGVSDNAVRKWVRTERARQAPQAGVPGSTTGQARQP